MDSKILEFLKKNRVSVLSVVLSDGMPHTSALHYSHKEEPLEFYFSTENTSRKCQGLLKGETTKGSLVVGFNEEEMITVQLDGQAQAVLDPAELEPVKKVHYAKHPEAKRWENDPATVFLKFTPTWWRYTDYNTSPVTYLSSEK